MRRCLIVFWDFTLLLKQLYTIVFNLRFGLFPFFRSYFLPFLSFASLICCAKKGYCKHRISTAHNFRNKISMHFIECFLSGKCRTHVQYVSDELIRFCCILLWMLNGKLNLFAAGSSWTSKRQKELKERGKHTYALILFYKKGEYASITNPY